MKIFACCNWKLKFLGPILDYWREQGHEVRYELGYNPAQHKWSDVCFIDVGDNNAIVGSRNRFPNSKLAVRVIDIEAWVKQPSGITWENVDVAIFGARHIWELVESYTKIPSSVQVQHIPFGIDPEQWTFKKHYGHKKTVGWIGRPWIAKGLHLALQIMMQLPEYRLECLMPDFKRPDWYASYIDHMIKSSGLDVRFTKSVESVDDWLQNKDSLIVSSMKEAFSYVAAEAALCGVRPVIHNFWRASDIWPENWIWNTVDEAAHMICSPPDSESYRRFIEGNYSLDKMMERINIACGIV